MARLTRPHYGAIARNGSMAACPTLWQGLTNLWLPMLGGTGRRVPNLAHGRAATDAVIDIDEVTWEAEGIGCWTAPTNRPLTQTGFYPSGEVRTVVADLLVGPLTDDYRFLGCDDGANHRCMLGLTPDGKGYFGYGTKSVQSPVGTIGLGRHQMAMVRHGSTVDCLINGRVVAALTGVSFEGTSPIDMGLGHLRSATWWHNRPLSAVVRSVATWDRALTLGEVQSMGRDPLAIVRPAWRLAARVPTLPPVYRAAAGQTAWIGAQAGGLFHATAACGEVAAT